jgi:phage terminase large subunit-like protein
MGSKGANYILEYYQKINDGSIIAGQWVHRLYDLLVKKLESKELFFDAKKAAAAIDYAESCHHVEGPLAPGLIKLELWQKAFLSCQYGLVDESGEKAFREILLVIARKNGKSVIGSVEGKYNFLKDGGYGARVYNIAPKLDQADIVYNNLWTMITLDEEWIARRDKLEADKKAKIRKDDPELARHRMTDLFLPATNSTAKKIAFSARKSDGFNPSLVICDEIASWAGDQGLKQYSVLKSGMGARPGAQILSCTTSGYVNDGIYDDLVKRATKFLMGESKEKRLLPFLYMIDDLEKWDDINELQKSNPNLGVSVSVDYLLDEIEVARGSLSQKAEFLTKYCCVKQNSSLAWLPAEVVNAASGPALHLEDFRDSYCVAGIDLSQTTDLTCALVVIEKDGELYVFAKFFMPAERVDFLTAEDGLPYNAYVQRGILQLSGENYVDYHDLYDWMVGLIEQYEIYPLMVGYDRYSSQYLIKDLDAYGFRTDDVYQGENLYPVIRETEGILKDGHIHIGDNDLLKIHLLNSAIKMSTERGRGKLVKINARDHIDGCAALLDGMCVRQKYWNELGDRLQNKE